MKLKGSEEERRPSAEGGAAGRVGGLFASRTSEGRLTSRMYFKTGEIKYQELNHLINTWVEELSRYFFKEEIQMANTYLKSIPYNWLSGKWKLKLLLKGVPRPSQWLSLGKQMINAVKNVREEEHVFTTLLLGSQLCAATMETRERKKEKGFTIWPSYLKSWERSKGI